MQGIAGAAGRGARAVPHRLGAAAAGADRPGRRPRRRTSTSRQSLNLFMARPTIGKLSSMYLYAWKAGLKTTYYLRSRPATRDPAGHGARSPRPAAERRGLLAGEPRVLRGLPVMLLDPGMDLTLRPMRYPHFYERFRDAIKNTWTVEEVDLHTDLADLRQALAGRAAPGRAGWSRSSPPATRSSPTTWCSTSTSTSTRPRAGSTCPGSCSRRRVHVQFYLNLLDTYVPDDDGAGRGVRRGREHPVDRAARPSSASGGSTRSSTCAQLQTRDDRRAFLLNLICFAACIEGLFFYGAFAYVYFLRSRGLLHGLASGTNWVFRDESMHMAFAFDVVDTVRARGARPVRRRAWAEQVREMLAEAVECEVAVRRGPARRRASPGMSLARHARSTCSTSPTGGSPSWASPPTYGSREPVRVHGAAGRAGAVQLLRAPGLGLPGRRDRHGQLRRRLLSASRTGERSFGVPLVI